MVNPDEKIYESLKDIIEVYEDCGGTIQEVIGHLESLNDHDPVLKVIFEKLKTTIKKISSDVSEVNKQNCSINVAVNG